MHDTILDNTINVGLQPLIARKRGTKMEEQKRSYKVEIMEKKGTCEDELFEIMAKNGDITSQKLADMIGCQVKITGYAICHIITDDKDFSITYFDTDEYGLISSGSQVFLESVISYFGKVDKVILTEIKTKKGKIFMGSFGKSRPVTKSKSKTAEKSKDKKEA